MSNTNLPAASLAAAIRALPSVTAMRIAFVVAVFLFFASAPLWSDRSVLHLAIEMATILALAMLWNLLAGYAGLVSMGQQAFVGLGGYVMFAFVQETGLSPLLGVPLSGLVAALVAIPTALLLFRLRGPYFAVGSWVVAEVYRLLSSQVTLLGGGSGISLPLSAVRAIAPDKDVRDIVIYYIAMGVVCGTWLMTWTLLRSRFGLALTAIRDSESAAASLGVDTKQVKLTVYIATAFATGIVGSLIFLGKLRISPDAAFSIQDWTADIIFSVVIGGIGTVEGPFFGTAVYFLLRWAFSDFGSWYLIGLGATAIGFMLLAPNGLWGLLSKHMRLSLFPIRRLLDSVHRVHDPL
ncbi:MAG TPA: branched-chain amino acid ABC transporter permease [Patescibacteria group bacterium]|nr:branched-chain amino acid ABC transporter permease [Patescibacteria group bacterium]